MAHQPGVHHELVLIDQSQFSQRLRELHASDEKSLTRLLLELLNGLSQIAAHELGVPIDPVQRARHDVLLGRVDRTCEGFRPIRHCRRLRRRPPRCLHHFVSHPAKKEGIGLLEVLDRVTMYVFVRDPYPMITAPVQCDVDGISKGSHYLLLKRADEPRLSFRSHQREPTLGLTYALAKATSKVQSTVRGTVGTQS